jgi:hypothetical protein
MPNSAVVGGCEILPAARMCPVENGTTWTVAAARGGGGHRSDGGAARRQCRNCCHGRAANHDQRTKTPHPKSSISRLLPSLRYQQV